MIPGRLSFDLWQPVSRDRLTTSVAVLCEGRKARTVEASLVQGGRPVARCTAVYLKADRASVLSVPAHVAQPRAPETAHPRTDPSPRSISSTPAAPVVGPDGGRPLPPHVKAWSPFFTGVDTRVIEGDLLRPGPAATWFNLGRALVAGEPNSPLVHAVSAADLASGISAVVDLRAWSFINADLTVVFWRVPRPPWILLRAETTVGDQGTGVARGQLADLDGAFGACIQTLIFERRA